MRNAERMWGAGGWGRDRHRVCRQTDRYTNSDTDIKSETDERRVFIEEITLNKYTYDNN